MTTNTTDISVVALEPLGKRRLVPAPGHPAKLVFEDFRGVIDDAGHGIRLWIDLSVPAGAQPEIVGFALQAQPGRSLHARELRQLPLDTYVRALVGFMLFDNTTPSPVHHAVVDQNPPRAGGVRWSRVSEQELSEVAHWWREATDAGQPTGPYVATKAKVSHNNARQLILSARRAGLIPPAK